MFQNIIEVLILSAIQGISEFLPISSSAHLILVSTLYEFKSSSLLIDISLHLGSLIAIIYFFKDELFDICLLYTSPSPRDAHESRMPSSA